MKITSIASIMKFLQNFTTILLLLLISLLQLPFQKVYCTPNELDLLGLIKCNATNNATNECPEHSKCNNSSLNSNEFYCQCLENYKLNPLFNETVMNLTSSVAKYCVINIAETLSNSTSKSSNETDISISNGQRTYKRQPAKVEHVAIGILLVLFVAIAAVVLLYLLKISKPIKRSKAAYTRLKRRHERRQRLEEFCEDDISMIQLNENVNQKL